jgi:hypothetical protein
LKLFVLFIRFRSKMGPGARPGGGCTYDWERGGKGNPSMHILFLGELQRQCAVATGFGFAAKEDLGVSRNFDRQ